MYALFAQPDVQIIVLKIVLKIVLRNVLTTVAAFVETHAVGLVIQAARDTAKGIVKTDVDTSQTTQVTDYIL